MTTLHPYRFDGDRLRRQRERVGVSRAELGRRIGCNESTLRSIESGLVYGPGIDLVVALADALGIEFVSFVRCVRARP